MLILLMDISLLLNPIQERYKEPRITYRQYTVDLNNRQSDGRANGPSKASKILQIPVCNISRWKKHGLKKKRLWPKTELPMEAWGYKKANNSNVFYKGRWNKS
eukprot:TRINITY_DN2031_c0_g1_i8.p1 TRINITY_DN2031_c0_g1~~TRINITY_DN2031_c0_g1_i8.p1  ORF type:complete len:103 (-),score=7.49 TRINITY_DN2031_c0_g1_i8:29-337(-)